MTPTNAAFHIDWIWSGMSNVQVANHRDWFTNFTPFETYITEFPRITSLDVHGIGDVRLRINSHPTNGESFVLHVKNVLYAPDAIVNILSFHTDPRPELKSNGPHGRQMVAAGGTMLLGKAATLSKFWLVGQERERSTLEAAGLPHVGAMWDLAERQRWKAYKPLAQRIAEIEEVGEGSDGFYSAAEKDWLEKGGYGREFGEYRFLQALGLSLFKDEDREQGRLTLRDMMEEKVGRKGKGKAKAKAR